jgi:hypothetical protein
MNHYFLDEKYKAAQLIAIMHEFTVSDIESEFIEPSLYLKDSIYSVIGELLDKGLVGCYESDKPNEKNLSLELVEPCKFYLKDYNDLEKKRIITEYIEQLSCRRIKPDIDGKPRSSNFRLAEKFLSDGITQPSIDKAYRYLGLAQIDEKIAEKSYDVNQIALSDAYIRSLYADYLIAKDFNNWDKAIPELIKSTKLFGEHDSLDMQKVCEAKACEILIVKFNKINQISIPDLIDFANSAENLIRSIPKEYCPIIFRFTYSQIINEIQRRLEQSQINDGQYSKIFNVYGETDKISNVYNLLNETRAVLNEQELSLNSKRQAKNNLEKARSNLEKISGEIEEIEKVRLEFIIEDHLKAVDASIEISNVNELDFQQKLIYLSEIKGFMGSELPFYWVNNISLLLSVVRGLGEKMMLLLDLDRELRREESIKMGDMKMDLNKRTSDIPREDYDDLNIVDGYSLEDWENIRESIFQHSSSAIHDYSLGEQDNRHELEYEEENSSINFSSNNNNSLPIASIEDRKDNFDSLPRNNDILKRKDIINSNTNSKLNEKYSNKSNQASKKKVHFLKGLRTNNITNNLKYEPIYKIRQEKLRELIFT